MASESQNSDPALVYRLSCTDCQFETTVQGDAFDALDEADAHRTETPAGHFVDFELTGR